MNIGHLLSGLVHSIFGNDGDGGGSPAVIPTPSPPSVPAYNAGHNVPDFGTPPTPSAGANPVVSAKSDAMFQTFMSAAMSALSGKGGAIMNSGANTNEIVSFGYFHDMRGTNPDGTTFMYQVFDPFGQVQETSYSNTVQSTNGGIQFGGGTTWSGFYDPNKVVQGQDVIVTHDSSTSSHDQVTLVGFNGQLPDIFDYGKG